MDRSVLWVFWHGIGDCIISTGPTGDFNKPSSRDLRSGPQVQAWESIPFLSQPFLVTDRARA